MRWHLSVLKQVKKWWKRPPKTRLWQAIAALGVALGVGGVLLVLFAVFVIAPNLPPLDALTDYRPKIPLRIYTADNALIGEFGEERRDFVPIAEMPAVLKNAVIAIEDDRFYEHGGVDIAGVLRAGVANLYRGSRAQGGSTITMQVARTFYLTRQKTYLRKLREVMLAFKIEDVLTKDQILELYMNQIFLGERAYGFGSAARIYFGKPVKDLTIAEAAMLAGLPQAPAAANPIVNPKRARQRQQAVLKRMRDLGYVTPAQYAQASAEKVAALADNRRFKTHAEYAAELVRQYMYRKYGDEIYTHGYIVRTTLVKADQDAAYAAVRRGVLDYDRRHGYRGPEDHIDLPADEDEREQAIDDALLKHPDSDELQSAIVISASPRAVRAELLSGETIDIAGDGLRFAASALSAKAPAQKRISRGSVIRVTRAAGKKWEITQLPEVAAALVALDAKDGSFRAMVGGFDFAFGKFDHVTQAWRQPGSGIKPFIYSAALEKGFSPGTLIDDAPLIINASDSGGQTWEPKNDDGAYEGPLPMRTALKKSKNLVSIRILRAITPAYARDYLSRFGFDADKQPNNLTMTLGTGSVTPLQMAAAYAVFANGGFQVTPYLIRQITDARGNVLSETEPARAGDEAARVLDPRNAFLIDNMLRDVVRSGTGYLAGQRLGRGDLAGKTGTTNDAMDGWFSGYGGDVVAVAWMGYDKPRSLGSREFGSTLALPIWVGYMREALRGQPESERPAPAGLVRVDGDWMYAEYVDSDNAIRALEVEQPKSLWERLFTRPPAAPESESEKEKRRMQELYVG